MSCLGCDGNPYPYPLKPLEKDACEVCGGDGSTCAGCDGVPNSNAVFDCEDVCGGDFAVYRFSFTLCLFFAAMTLLCAGTSKLGARTHRGQG